MRYLIITFVLILNAIVTTAADYQAAMKQALAQLEAASTPDQWTEAANRFERIAQAEAGQWLPWYYAAYATLNTAILSSEAAQKDRQLDEAQRYLDQALALEAEESEIMALQGYLHTIRVTVDPAARGQQLAPRATQTLVRALKMNPDNPRALFLLGQMQYGTAQFFGSSTSDACKLIGQAVDKFASATTDDPLMPSWGEANARARQAKCEE